MNGSTTQAQPPQWSAHASEELYKVKNWGAGFFDVASNGELEVSLRDAATGAPTPVSLASISRRLKAMKIGMPFILRFPDLLARRIEDLHHSFHAAIADHDYGGRYRGVFPIKVNQKQEVIEEIVRFGAPYNYGLEVGSKCELLAALGTIEDFEAHVICNGYKDESYIDLALLAMKTGVDITLVLEMPSELEIILQRAEVIGVSPRLGVRVRLSMKGSGYWGTTSGDTGLFGLNVPQLLNVVDKLKAQGKLGYLKMLHFHQGSQLCELDGIRQAAREAARVYVELHGEGAALEYLNLGGGLAVDYEGTNSNSNGSKDYDLPDYCGALVETVKEVADAAGVPHPNLITESGRGIAAYYSALVFNILDVSEFKIPKISDPFPDYFHPRISEMLEATGRIGSDESIHDHLLSQLLMWRSELQELFSLGELSIRELSTSEQIYREGMTALGAAGHEQAIEARPPIDFLYGNFSVFQSLPDHWALQQIFPVMPIHRLDEFPNRVGIIADLTCDCDGQIKSYVQNEAGSSSLPIHESIAGEDYIFGIFLVGAYQETLGDMHNLFGDTNAVSVEVLDGEVSLELRTEGDTAQEVLGYLDYEHQKLIQNVIRLGTEAELRGDFVAGERERFVGKFADALAGYTYLHSATE